MILMMVLATSALLQLLAAVFLGSLPVAEYSGEAIKNLLPSIKSDFILKLLIP